MPNRSSGAGYSVVHLVSQEVTKDLIGPQVVDHMQWQRTAPGPNAPRRVAVGLLEPARSAVTSGVRRRVAALGERAPDVKVALLPYVGRLGLRRNAALLARRVRALAGGERIVLHCRGESAGEWALALAPHLRDAGIVADIRGAWPEELLFLRGFDGVDEADAPARRDYEAAMSKLRTVLSAAGSVISVSDGMLEWLRSVGVSDDKLAYVPCCVRQVAFSAADRERIRRDLGVAEKLVVAYAGTVTRYQHLEDGLIPFFRALHEQCGQAHLLCLTNDVDCMRAMLANALVAPDAATVVRVDQSDTAAYLSAADAGLLLRAPSVMNRFSQPTKLGEYLSSGVPVIVSRGTGIVGELVEGNCAGMQIDWFSQDQEGRAREAGRIVHCLTSRSVPLRAGALALCEREFLWSTYVNVVREAYGRSLRDTDRSVE